MEKKNNIEGGDLEKEEDKEKARNVNGRKKKRDQRRRWSTWKLPVVVVVYGRHTGVTRTLARVRGGGG